MTQPTRSYLEGRDSNLDDVPRPDKDHTLSVAHGPSAGRASEAGATVSFQAAGTDVGPVAGEPTTWPRIAGYEIEEVLGRGGMGVVYKAWHLALKRTVALKMILAGGHAGPVELARFRSEAETVARLQHPNIVQIYDIGAAAGQPFCALEYVAGGSLDRKLGGAPQPPAQAGRLVETLARALHAAHLQGIVHRDLKPANILLQTAERGSQMGEHSHDSSCQSAISNLQSEIPKVTDFGLAKKLDEVGQTVSGSILGTPSYMAPEQAAGRVHDIGPLVDVYALGAILYECLTGRPPFKGVTFLDTLAMVRAQEPVPPTSLQPAIPLDLETICLKCLHKEPAKRYGSALDLADDLGRFGRGEPILARPVGRIERTWRWCRRNRGIAAALTLVALTLLAATAVSVTAALTINAAHLEEIKARDDAVEQRKNAERHAQRASEGLKLASAALDAAVNKITENPRLRDSGFHGMRKELLASVLPFYEQLATLESDDPKLEAERARAYGKLAIIRHWMGESEPALAAGRKMEAVFNRLIEKYPTESTYLFSAAYNYNSLYGLFGAEGMKDTSDSALLRAEDLAERLLQVAPHNVEHQRLRLMIYLNRAKGLLWAKKYEPALDMLLKAESFQAEAVRLFPATEVIDLQVDLADLHTTRGFCFANMKKPADAEKSYRTALAVVRPVAEAPGASQDHRYMFGQTLNLLAAQLLGTNRPQEAHKMFEEARQLYVRLCVESPDVPRYRQRLGETLHNQANACNALGQREKATELRRESLRIFEKHAAEFPQHSGVHGTLGLSYINMGGKELELDNPALALEWFTKATAILEPMYRHDPENYKQALADSHRGVASSLGQLSRNVESITAADRALALDGGENLATLRSSRSWNILLIRQASVPALRLARKGDHVQAVAAIDALVKGPNAHVEMDFNAACVYGICAARVKEKEPQLAQGYGDKAVALLLKARQAGFFKDAAMLKLLREDDDFTALRGRTDFEKLQEDLTGGK